jgi:flagellar hook-associated protein 3 FlgL
MTNISSYALAASSRLTVSQAQQALSKAQVELSSGKFADIGLGLGSASGNYVSLNGQQSRLQAIKDSNSTTASTLTAAYSGLDALRTTATSFLASLTQASGTGSVSGTLVATAGGNLDSLISTLNTSVGGNAVFGGIDSGSAPMTAYTDVPTASKSKAAVDASFSTAFGIKQTSSDAATISGQAMTDYLNNQFSTLFSSGYQGTWSSASDTVPTAQISTTETVDTSVSANAAPFRQLAQAYAMVKEFGGSNFGSDAGQAVIAAATSLVSSAVASLTQAQAGIGLSQTAVSDADDRISTQIDYLSTQASDMVAVDPTALATQISGLQTQIQASYEITSQLQQLSLVNYLK